MNGRHQLLGGMGMVGWDGHKVRVGGKRRCCLRRASGRKIKCLWCRVCHRFPRSHELKVEARLGHTSSYGLPTLIPTLRKAKAAGIAEPIRTPVAAVSPEPKDEATGGGQMALQQLPRHSHRLGCLRAPSLCDTNSRAQPYTFSHTN